MYGRNETPKDNTPARCHHCKWEGTVGELVATPVPNPQLPGDIIKEAACPRCFQFDEIETKED